jgi:hypothetical protein
MYKNFFIIIFIFFNTIYIFSAGKNESDTAVIAVNEYRGNLPFYVYKKKGKLWISTYQEIDNKQYNIKHFPIEEGINIKNEYMLYNSNNIVFLYTNNILYTINIDTNEGDFINKTNKKLKILKTDVNHVWFYDNRCFYSDKSGRIFIYNEKQNNFIQCEGIIKKPHITNSVIVKTDLLAIAAKDTGDEWFNGFSKKILKIDLTSKPNDEIFNNNDKILLKRYKNFFRKPNGGINMQTDLKVWISNMQKKYRELDEEKSKIRQDFLKKWNITDAGIVEELVIEEIINNYCSSWIPMGVKVKEKIRHGKSEIVIELPPKKNAGKSDIIKTDKIIFKNTNQNSDIFEFYISAYNDLLDLEKKLYRDVNKEIAKTSKKLLKENYDFFKSAIINELKKKIDDFYNAYKKLKIDFKKKDDEFIDKILTDINRIEFTDNDIEEQNFDYIHLLVQNEDISVDSYTIVYHNSLEKLDDLLNFENLGQKTNLLGIIDNYIYACDRGNLILYDIFTLKKESSEFNLAGKILFSINHEKNFFVTVAAEESKDNIYYLNKIMIDDDGVKKEIKLERIKNDDIISNVFFINNKFSEPFYSYVLDNNTETDKIYVNKRKIVLPFGKRIKTKKSFKYIETPAGSGMILQ